jgi:methylated-DNA-protein-cysteine methyltransferase related protein
MNSWLRHRFCSVRSFHYSCQFRCRISANVASYELPAFTTVKATAQLHSKYTLADSVRILFAPFELLLRAAHYTTVLIYTLRCRIFLFRFPWCPQQADRAIEQGDKDAGPFELVPLQCSICEMNSLNWNPVYAEVKKIPRGRVATYGQIARLVRLHGGARSAGRAMAACPSGQGIPWHRVVGAGGRLLLREPNAGLQRKLLEREGLHVAGRRILGFSVCQWSPEAKYGRKVGARKT